MIKKFITPFFIAFLLSFTSFSQKLEIALKGGPSFATQKLENITGVESITGYHVGGHVYLKLPLIFGIQIEGQYSTQGSEFQVNQVINKNKYEYTSRRRSQLVYACELVRVGCYILVAREIFPNHV